MSRIGWMFGIGHGHYTQFLNFQECYPDAERERAEWIPLPMDHSGSMVAQLPGLPSGARARLHQLWHAQQGVARQGDWHALFFASEQLAYIPLLRRYPSYLYKDLTPSLRRELAPWYDHQLTGGAKGRVRDLAWTQFHGAFRGIFTMSRWAADGVSRDYGVPAGRVHVALPGANLRRWHFTERAARPPSAPVRVLMVGGQFSLKGGPLLLDWAERTRATGWELDVVTWPGELPPWMRDALGNPAPNARVSASLAPRLPNVRVHCGLMANTPQLMALFEAADVFCLPTQADGSSIASLEAMASGLPVIVGAVGGIPELIRDGETGFLVPRVQSGSTAAEDALAARLEELIGDRALRLSIGRAARESCERFYNVDRQLREILAVIG